MNITTMEIYTVEEFQQRWDEMIGRVEKGEKIGITNGKDTAIMISADDELVRIYSEHDEAP
jgi:antitoxin (DNA-binding transcriptional repressor) of toxin-antitoxin stability system